jgi:hypothetical protein
MCARAMGDLLRQAFLQNLLAGLGDGETPLHIEYRQVTPFPGIGAVLTTEGVPGALILIPLSVADGVKIFGSFPGPGKPHVDLYVTRSSGSDWLTGLSARLCSCNNEELVTAIRSWRDQTLPREPIEVPPLATQDLEPLRALAAARRLLASAAAHALAAEVATRQDYRKALGLVDETDCASQIPALRQEAREHLAADLACLDPVELLSNAPRDAHGRLALSAAMLLAAYETIEPQRPTYQLWLAAHTPTRRRDPQVVTLKLRPLIGENHPLRWDSARWLWNSRAQGIGEAERWGVTGLPVAALGLEGRQQRIATLEMHCGPAQGDLRDRVWLCMLLQDEGRIEAALALCGVELAPALSEILRGHRLHLDYGKTAERWARFLQEELRSAAPWRFAATIEAEADRLRAWARARRGRKVRAPRLRLFPLPNQTQQSKTLVMLVGVGPDFRLPRLDIEYTAWNARLAEPLWRRPLDLDLVRFGLEPPAGPLKG